MARNPGRMLCHRCMRDLGPDRFDEDEQVWIYTCPDCVDVDGQLTITVAEPGGSGSGSLRDGSGIMARLGLYDGLIEALSEEPGRWLEFGVVEHLYAQVDHEAYRELVERYGHVALEPDNNTASWMLGRALWALKRQGEVLVKPTTGTGRWDYLTSCNAWTLPPKPQNRDVLSWSDFAERESIPPEAWPAIDWTETRRRDLEL